VLGFAGYVCVQPVRFRFPGSPHQSDWVLRPKLEQIMIIIQEWGRFLLSGRVVWVIIHLVA